MPASPCAWYSWSDWPRCRSRRRRKANRCRSERRSPFGRMDQWRMDQWNRLAAAPAIDAEIIQVRGDYRESWIQLAHTDQAQVRKIRTPVCIAGCQLLQTRKVRGHLKFQPYQPFTNKCQHQGTAAQVKCRFRQNRIARQQGLGNLLRQFRRPCM